MLATESAPTAPPLRSPSIVHTGKDGAFVDDAARSAVEEAFANDLPGAEKVVLYFHGGLNNAATGMKIARSLDPVLREAGAYPLFFVWESGLFEILSHNIAEIAGEDFFKILLKMVLKFGSAKLTETAGGRAADGSLALPNDMQVYQELALRDLNQEPYARLGDRTPVTDLSEGEEFEFREYLSQNPDFSETVDAISASILPEATVSSSRGVDVRIRKAGRTLMSPEVLEELREDTAVAAKNGARGVLTSAVLLKHAVRVLARVISRFRRDRAHGLYPTAVEEILREFYVANAGVNIWGAMKGETHDTFQPATPLRGGQYVVEKLAELIRAGHRPEITLIGHSTGAVFINNLLAYAEAQRLSGKLPADFAFKRVIFLAPACTFKAFSQYVQAPYFGQPGGLYESIRVFAMTDEAERKDALVPFVYPRSLLYFVSGVLEAGADGGSAPDVPLVGMQRYYTDAATYTEADIGAVRAFVAAAGDRSVWSPCSSGAGLSSQSRHHGDFDDDTATRESVAYLIKGA
jgi:hypothetical protein